jgi:hypothetical protein
MIHSNNLQHPIAIVLTKCDLVRSQAKDWQILEKNLQPLKNYLKNLKINYKFFYSSIPIVSTDGMSNLITTDSAAPILWLVSKLRGSDNLSFNDGVINPVN